MRDRERRELERRYRESGSLDDATALIQVRLREGTLDLSRVQWAAALGYEPARRIEPGEVSGLSAEESPGSVFKACLASAGLEKSTLALIACAFAEQALPAWESRHPDHHRLRAAIETARRAAVGSVPAIEVERALADAGHVMSRYEDNCEGVGSAIRASLNRLDLPRAAQAAQTAWSRVSDPDPETGVYQALGGNYVDEAQEFQHELLAAVLCGLQEPRGPSETGAPRRDPPLAGAERAWREAPSEESARAYLIALTERGRVAYDLLVAAALAGYRPARLAVEACRTRCAPLGESRQRPADAPPIAAPEQLLGLVDSPESQRAIRVWSCDCVARLARYAPEAISLQPVIDQFRDVAQGVAPPARLEEARAGLASWHQETFYGRTHLLNHGGEGAVGWVFMAAEALSLEAWGLARRIALQGVRWIQCDRLPDHPHPHCAASRVADTEAEWQAGALCALLASRSGEAETSARSDLRDRDYARFRVTSGPSKGRLLLLYPGRFYALGRGREVDLRVEGDEKVSRFHATVDWQAGSWFARDARSSQGLLHNGEAVRSHRLDSGDVLTLGSTTILFEGPAQSAIRLEAPKAEAST